MLQLLRRPVVIIVRDGWGHNPYPEWDKANAVLLANTPVNDRLLAEYPHVQIHTSGENVGLPPGVMGNSEVGHQNIGAGRIVDQELMRITRTVRDGSFFKNETLRGAFEHAKKSGGSVHLLGLFSDGRVHSDMDHAFAIVELCKQMGFDGSRFFVHAITDGRDTPPNSGLKFVQQLEAQLKKVGVGRVASVIGRYYIMDRDNRWDRVEKAYRMLTKGDGRTASSATQGIQDYYDHPTESNRTGDEFIVPTVVVPPGMQVANQLVKPGDAVIFFNYRGDRPREITKAFMLSDEEWAKVPNGGFDRNNSPHSASDPNVVAGLRTLGGQMSIDVVDMNKVAIDEQLLKSMPIKLICGKKIIPFQKVGDTLRVATADPYDIAALDDLRMQTGLKIEPVLALQSQIESIIRQRFLYFATMTAYEQGLPVRVIFVKPPKMVNILGEYVSQLGLKQFRSAETEKYPHVTFFFNDYRDEPFAGEDRQIVPSPRDVTTYDQKPQMSAYEVTEEMLRRIASGTYDLMVLNYANGDMVGHTGSLPAAIKAVEAVDECVGKVVDAVLAKGGALIVTADHGNCEQMIDPATGGPHTAHTVYDVDLIVVDDRFKKSRTPLREDGRLADIAPTALVLMGLPQPTEMTGRSLLPSD